MLPRLRASRGRVVFVSSVSGRVATPMTGAYNASKFALEGLADTLRIELSPWGVRVALVEPTQTDTDLWRRADDLIDESLREVSAEQRELYARHIAGYRKTIPLSQKLAVPADNVAATIERALTDLRPRTRYVVGRGARAQVVMAGLTPTPVLDSVLRVGSRIPRRIK